MKCRPSILFFILFIFLISYCCTQKEYCTDSLIAEVNINFYKGKIDSLVKNNIYLFWAKGLGNDSLINADTTVISGIGLQLSEIGDTCIFIFDYSFNIDTLTTYVLQDTITDLDTIVDTTSVIYQDTALMNSFPDTLSSKLQYIKIRLQDTLHFYYERELTYISAQCGFMYNFKLQSVVSTHNYIDTILIINPYISTLDEDNIQILFKPVDLYRPDF